MAFGTRSHHTRHRRLAAQSFPLRLRAWRQRENLSQSEAALKLQISKRTLQEWEQARATPHGFAHRSREGDSGAANARCSGGETSSGAIRESRIASCCASTGFQAWPTREASQRGVAARYPARDFIRSQRCDPMRANPAFFWGCAPTDSPHLVMPVGPFASALRALVV